METKENETTLRIQRIFRAPREKVFEAWTRPEHLTRWFVPSAEYTSKVDLDLREGGEYRIVMTAPNGKIHDLRGVYREITPPRKLVYTWAWQNEPQFGETVVSIEFLDHEQGTEIVLTHQRFPDEPARNEHNKGWTGCLDRLEQFVA